MPHTEAESWSKSFAAAVVMMLGREISKIEEAIREEDETLIGQFKRFWSENVRKVDNKARGFLKGKSSLLYKPQQKLKKTLKANLLDDSEFVDDFNMKMIYGLALNITYRFLNVMVFQDIETLPARRNR